MIDLWADMAHVERFRDEQIIPHTRAVGIAAPRVRVLEVDEQKHGSGDAPAFVQCVILPGLTREAFHAADGQILPTGEIPHAITFHVNGPVDGGWCVIDGWTSKQARDEFLEAHVRPVMEDAPLSGPPRFEDMTVEASMTEAAPAAA